MQRTVIFAILAAFCLAGCARPAPERPLPTSVGAAPLADAPSWQPLPTLSPLATCRWKTRPLLRRRPRNLRRQPRRPRLRLSLRRPLAQNRAWRPHRDRQRHALPRGIRADCRTSTFRRMRSAGASRTRCLICRQCPPCLRPPHRLRRRCLPRRGFRVSNSPLSAPRCRR